MINPAAYASPSIPIFGLRRLFVVGMRLDEHEGRMCLATSLNGLGAQALASGLHDDVRDLWQGCPFSNMQHTQHTESHVEFRCSKCSSSHILNHTGNPVCFPRYFFHTMPSHSVWIAVGRRTAILHVAAAALLSLAGNADGSTTVGNAIPGVEHVERTSLNQHFLNN